jgi:hypothetical protein
MFRAQMTNPLGLKIEQEYQRARCPDVNGHVVKAMLEQCPAFVVAEQIRWLLSRDHCDSKTSGEATIGCPFSGSSGFGCGTEFDLYMPLYNQ